MRDINFLRKTRIEVFVRKTRIEVYNFKNAYININVGVLYLKLFMHVTVCCFVLLWSVLFCYGVLYLKFF